MIIRGFINSFLFKLTFSIFCGGSFVLDFIANISVGAPNNPDRRGRRGWLTPELRFISPRKPARRNIIIDFTLDSLFEINKINDAQIRISPIRLYEAE